MSSPVTLYGNGVQTRFEVPGSTQKKVYVGGVLTVPTASDFESVTITPAPGPGVPVAIDYSTPRAAVSSDTSRTPVLFTSIPLTAVTVAGKRQAIGGATQVLFSAGGPVSFYVRWSDASGLVAVSTNDTLVSLTATSTVTLAVPSGFPFLEYLLASGGPGFTAGLMV